MLPSQTEYSAEFFGWASAFTELRRSRKFGPSLSPVITTRSSHLEITKCVCLTILYQMTLLRCVKQTLSKCLTDNSQSNLKASSCETLYSKLQAHDIHHSFWAFRWLLSVKSLTIYSAVASDGDIYKSAQCQPGLTYIFNFWHSGTLALMAECPNVRN